MAARLGPFDFSGMPELGGAPIAGALGNGAAPLPSSLSDSAHQQTSSSAAGVKQPIPLACVACRSKHLKCSGGEPCSRCATDGNECSYVKSRRVCVPLPLLH